MKSFQKKFLIFGIITVVAFALAMAFATDDAEAGHGQGVATIFPSYVVAGDYYSFVITYTVPEGGFNDDDGNDPGWQVTIPSVEEYAEWNSATDPWSLPQNTNLYDFGYCTVEGAHKNDATLSISGRTVTITYNGGSGFPAEDEDLVLRYGNLLYRSQVQLHNELDVDFHTEVDEHGEGTFAEIADHPNADVVPGAPDKIIVTILGIHDYVQIRKFNPNPYVSPFQIHTSMDGTIRNPIPPDQVSGLDFRVEIRLTDRYLNLITDGKGDQELDLQWGSVSDPPDAIPGKSPSPCLDSPEIEDSYSVWNDFYAPGPFPYTKNDVPVQFIDGVGTRYDINYNAFTYFHVQLYKVETDISLYVKNNQLYEWNTQLFDTLSPFQGTPLNFHFGPCAYTDGDTTWINGDTPIFIENELGLDEVTIQYRVYYDGEWTEWQDGEPGDDVEFTMNELEVGGECEHIIEYKSYDKYCNYGPTLTKTVYVDNTAPTSSATIHGDQVAGNGFTWIDYDSYITLDCTDDGCQDDPGPAGNKWTLFRYAYETVWYPQYDTDNEWGLTPTYIDEHWYYIYEEGTHIWWGTDCQRTIVYRNIDNVCNLEDEKQLDVRVDGTPPESNGWFYGDGSWVEHEDTNQIVNDEYWITSDTGIELWCYDYGCPTEYPTQGGVGTYNTYYRWLWVDANGDETWYPAEDEWAIYTGPIYFPEGDCKHTLWWWNDDLLGNEEDPINVVYFWVDDTPPESGWDFYGDGKWVEHTDTNQILDDEWWITSETGIELLCEDDGCDGGVGTDNTYYRWLWVDENGDETWYPSIDGWATYSGPIYFPEGDCKRTLWWWNDDLLGNEEDPPNVAYFWVDDTPPESGWDWVDDTYDPIEHLDVTGAPDGYWIDWYDEIYLYCFDYGCDDGVGTELTYWRYEWTDVYGQEHIWPETGTPGRDDEIWSVYNGFPIYWFLDCKHTIYFYNVDLLGNVETQVKSVSFWVDGTAPESGWGWYGDGTYVEHENTNQIQGDEWWITSETGIVLWCYDYGCPTEYPEYGGVGTYNTYYRWLWVDDSGTETWYPAEDEWAIYSGPIYFPEGDCKRTLWWWNDDLLGNEEDPINVAYFWVDDTKPVSGYQFAPGLGTQIPTTDHGALFWIDYDTRVHLTCYDLGCAGGVGDTITYFGYTDTLSNWHPTSGIDMEFGTPVDYGGTLYWVYVYDDPGTPDDEETVISWDDDCFHDIYWFNVDALGNEEGYHYLPLNVDGTPPESDWEWGDPNYVEIPHDSGGYWIDWFDEIYLYCDDYGCPEDYPTPGGVGTELTYWRYEWTDVDGVSHKWPETGEIGRDDEIWAEYDGSPIFWDRDCKHTIYFYNVDLLGNVEINVQSETFWVDGTPPISGWGWVDQNYDPIEHLDDTGAPDGYWINWYDEIYLYCDDYGCPTKWPVTGGVGNLYTYWRYEWTDGQTTRKWPATGTPGRDDEIWMIYDGYPIFWYEDCKHTIYFYNVDRLDNEETTVQSVSFWVDGTQPESDYEITGPQQQDDNFGPDEYRISYESTVVLTCEDYGCFGGVGGTTTYYREEYYPPTGDPIPTPDGSGDLDYDGHWWLEYTEPLSWNTDCKRVIYVINVDALGNIEDPPTIITVYVDGTKPESDWGWGSTAKYLEHDNTNSIDNDEWWITPGTEIELSCIDYGCIPGDTTTYYRWEWWDEDGNLVGWYPDPWGDFAVYNDEAISWDDDCLHILYFYNVDDLGNVEDVNTAYFHVDGTPPVPSVDYGSMDPAGYYDPNTDGDDDPSTGGAYIDVGTDIYLTADDGDGICDVGIPDCGIRYRIWYDGVWHPYDDADDYGGNPVDPTTGPVAILFWNDLYWYHYEGPFHFTEECTHKIVLDAMDKLENHYDPDYLIYSINGEIAPYPNDPDVVGYGVGGYAIDSYSGYLYVDNTQGGCDIYHVSIPTGSDPNAHDDLGGTTVARTLTYLETFPSTVFSGTHVGEFQIDDYHIYYGDASQGVYMWDKAGNGYSFGTPQGQIIPGQLPTSAVPGRSETLAYDSVNGIFYAGTRGRTMYQWNNLDTWVPIFTYTAYPSGDHHDGLEFVNGYLWVQDMYADFLGQWEKVGGIWQWKQDFSWTNPHYVEGLGFGPLGHFWFTSGAYAYDLVEFGGGALQQELEEKWITFWVEDMAPYIKKTVGDCNVQTEPWDGDDIPDYDEDYDTYWVSSSTPIIVDAWDLGCPTVYIQNGPTDPAPGGSGLYDFYYGILLWDEINEEWNLIETESFFDITLFPDGAPWTLYFKEECVHALVLVAVDNLGHYTYDLEFFYVDNTPPTTTFDYDHTEGQSGECEGSFWITGDTYITLTAEDAGCLDGVGVATIWFEVEYMGTWHGPYKYLYPFTLNMLIVFAPYGYGLGDDCDHQIRWWAVDEVCNIEDPTHTVNVESFKVSNVPPVPDITNPVYDWYYRPGYIMTLTYTEAAGGGAIVGEAWSYSFDQTTWYPIVDWNDGGVGWPNDDPLDHPLKPGIQWNTADIPDPLCDEGPVKVYVRVIVYDEHCRSGEDIEEIWFCEAENPHPCTQTITFGYGWNLISIAVELDSLGGAYTASKLAAEINGQTGEDIVKYIVRWDAVENEFNEYVVDNAVGWDFPINKGEGYYIYIMVGDPDFEADFVIVGDCAECEYIDLNFCWNLVGWDSMDSMWVGDFVTLVNFIAGADVVQAVVRHVNGDVYQAWYPGDNPLLFEMETNHAYWVFVSQPVSNIPLP